MSFDNRTPEQKATDAARNDAAEARVDATEARVDAAVAQDVAEGMAAKATVEEVRADAYAAQNTRQAIHMNELRAERNAAAASGAIARDQARRSSFGFWMLAGIIGAALVVWGAWAALRPSDDTTTTIVRQPIPVAAAPAATAAPIATPAPSTPAQTVVVEKPVVVEKQVPVPVPVPVPAAQETAAPAATPAPAPENVKPDSPNSETLHGYIAPESGN